MKNYYLERDGIEFKVPEKPYIIVSDVTFLCCDERDAYVVYEECGGILKLIGWTTDDLMEDRSYVN